MKPIQHPTGIILGPRDVVIEVEGDPAEYAYLVADGENPDYRRLKIDRAMFDWMRETQPGEFVKLPP